MLITNLSVAKVDKSDPRYPDPQFRKDGSPFEFAAVYRVAFDTDDGRELEAVLFVDPLTPDSAAQMLKAFAGAVERSEVKAAA